MKHCRHAKQTCRFGCNAQLGRCMSMPPTAALCRSSKKSTVCVGGNVTSSKLASHGKKNGVTHMLATRFEPGRTEYSW